MNIDLSEAETTVDQLVQDGQFIEAANYVAEHMSCSTGDTEQAAMRSCLMTYIATRAFATKDNFAMNHIYRNHRSDLELPMLELLAPDDFDEEAVTREWTPPPELLARVQGS